MAGTTSYTASVANSVSAITLTPTVNDSNATVEYLNASDAAITDTDTTTPALDAPLVVGANTFKVKVTSEAGATSTETYTVVVTRAADTTPPSPESAEVRATGITIQLTFDEALDVPEFLPAALAGAFSVTAAGADLPISGLVAFGGSHGRSLVISLTSGTTIYQNQTVTISYDKTTAGADALEDAADNEVATFTDFAVTNNSTVALDTTPRARKARSVRATGTTMTADVRRGPRRSRVPAGRPGRGLLRHRRRRRPPGCKPRGVRRQPGSLW